MNLLLCLAAFVGIPLAAVYGAGYRMLYVGGAFLAFLLSVGVFALGSGPMPLDATPAELRGAEFIETYAPAVGGWFFVAGLASVLGTLLFRASTPAPQPIDAAKQPVPPV